MDAAFRVVTTKISETLYNARKHFTRLHGGFNEGFWQLHAKACDVVQDVQISVETECGKTSVVVQESSLYAIPLIIGLALVPSHIVGRLGQLRSL